MGAKIIFRIKGENYLKTERRTIKNRILSFGEDDYLTSTLKGLPVDRDALAIIGEYLTFDCPNTNLVGQDYSYNIIIGSDMGNSKFVECEIGHSLFYAVYMQEMDFNLSTLDDVSFYKVDLENSTFQNVRYKNGVFKECLLKGIVVSHSCLDDSVFSGDSPISNTTFKNTGMKKVKFTDIELDNVLFEDTILDDAIFSFGNLKVMLEKGSQEDLNIKKCKTVFLTVKNGNLNNSKLDSIEHGKIIIEDTHMKEIKFIKVVSGLEITNCDMDNARINTCTFRGGKLSHISSDGALFKCINAWNLTVYKMKGKDNIFEGCHFEILSNTVESIEWEKVKLEKSKFSECSFHSQKLKSCSFITTELQACNIDKTTFYKLTLQETSVYNTEFNKCSFEECNLDKAEFISCTFEKCNFDDTTMNNIEFNNCTFEKCKFTKTDLDKSKFINCNTKGIKLVNSKDTSVLKVEKEEDDIPYLETKEVDIPDDITIYEVAKQYPPTGWKEHFRTKDNELKRVSNLIEKSRKDTGDEITPPNNCIFRAFQLTPLSMVRVVIIGQDPYPAAGVATGLAFSTHPFSPVPASLKNIYKEIASSCKGFVTPDSGCLDHWAKQGVFLINTCLTCPVGKAGGHSKYNIWIPFISSVLKLIGETNKDCFYMLWGKPAQECKQYIKAKEDRILSTSHPSPLSASRGFLGCGHFALINKKLVPPIKW